MARLVSLCLGAFIFLALVAGLLWMPVGVLASPEGPQDARSNVCPTVHKIALGENLTWIAAEYGVSVEALIEENGIEDADLIVENQALCIPARKRGSLSEWGSYGLPGHSYDPAWMRNQEGNGPQGSRHDDGPSREPDYDNRPQEGWKPQENYPGGYEVLGKAGQPTVKKSSGYWKDDLGYPSMNYNPVDPNEGEEPEPEIPTGTENGTQNGTENGNNNEIG